MNLLLGRAGKREGARQPGRLSGQVLGWPIHYGSSKRPLVRTTPTVTGSRGERGACWRREGFAVLYGSRSSSHLEKLFFTWENRGAGQTHQLLIIQDGTLSHPPTHRVLSAAAVLRVVRPYVHASHFGRHEQLRKRPPRPRQNERARLVTFFPPSVCSISQNSLRLMRLLPALAACGGFFLSVPSNQSVGRWWKRVGRADGRPAARPTAAVYPSLFFVPLFLPFVPFVLPVEILL